MASNLKDIKKRIASVKSLEKTATAMEMVASSKLASVQKKVEISRPYFERIYDTMMAVAMETSEFSSIFSQNTEVDLSCFVVIAGDRGMAGSYNTNVFKYAEKLMDSKNSRVIAVGKKSVEYFRKSPIEVIDEYPNIAEAEDPHAIYRLSQSLKRRFEKKEFQEIFVLYTSFISVLDQEPASMQLLPLYVWKTKGRKKTNMEFEPSSDVVFSSMMDQYLNGVVNGAILESFASEQGARQTAMNSAKDNADEMLKELQTEYNRVRQAEITNEINEIVSGTLKNNEDQ